MTTMHLKNSLTNDTPQFQHDCECCHFLGRYLDKETYQSMDLYAHTSNDNPTVIARTGVDGDYMSGLPFAYGSIAPLTEARRRAQAAGVLPYHLNSALAYTTEDEDCRVELKDAIVVSPEWRALLAFESHDVAASQALVNTLVDIALAKNKEHNPSALRLAASFDVTRRIDKMIQVMRSDDPLQSMTLSESATKFIWSQSNSAPGSGFSPST